MDPLQTSRDDGLLLVQINNRFNNPHILYFFLPKIVWRKLGSTLGISLNQINHIVFLDKLDHSNENTTKLAIYQTCLFLIPKFCFRVV